MNKVRKQEFGDMWWHEELARFNVSLKARGLVGIEAQFKRTFDESEPRLTSAELYARSCSNPGR